ncbi:MAG: RagB/SusD family nutrient uptake outer membrane protein [Niabella sp.]
MKHIILIFLCASALTSCTKFLEEEPRSSLTSKAYYETEAQALANVNALYRRGATQRYSYASSAYIGPTASINTMLTGYFTNSYEGQELICLYAKQLTRQNNLSVVSSTMNTIWDGCYEAINIANAAIKYIPEIDMDSETANELVAEAKFFRAFNYFYLVKTFGDVPLFSTPYESLDDDLYLERSSVESVYDLIESDLTEAAAVLPAVTFASNAHRITKYVAEMTLANVYLQQSDYANAAEAAAIVINSPHGLTANTDLTTGSAYNTLRKTDDLDEVIYAQEYDASINNSSWWPTYSFNSSAVSLFTTYSIFERVFGPTDRFLNVYTATDLRIQPNQFFHWTYTNPSTGKTWTSSTAGVWYYYDEDALLNTGIGTKDWNFYRYPEALLIAAEALAKSTNSVSATAAGYLAQVRARASTTGASVAQITSQLQALSADDFVEECWTERLREFPLEFKMWDDCLRTKMFPVISASEKGSVEYVSLVGASNGYGATFTESDLLWPVSADELQRNPNLTQNPGYSN